MPLILLKYQQGNLNGTNFKADGKYSRKFKTDEFHIIKLLSRDDKTSSRRFNSSEISNWRISKIVESCTVTWLLF